MVLDFERGGESRTDPDLNQHCLGLSQLAQVVLAAGGYVCVHELGFGQVGEIFEDVWFYEIFNDVGIAANKYGSSRDCYSQCQ